MKTLQELLDAIKAGEVEAHKVVAFLDNDDVSFYKGSDSDDHLLSLHPHEVQEQALAALRIKTEAV